MTDYQSISAGLSSIASEHGVPNGVGLSELARMLDPPNEAVCRLSIGRILTSERTGLDIKLAKSGLRVIAYRKTPNGMLVEFDIDSASDNHG